jgi:hypothetical protein
METKRKTWKGGRPAKIIKRKLVIGVRLTTEEHFIVKQKAEKSGLSFSRYLREMGIKGEVKMRLTEEDRQIVREIIGRSSNLNQLAKLAHKEGLLRIILEFESLRNRLDEPLKKLKGD